MSIARRDAKTTLRSFRSLMCFDRAARFPIKDLKDLDVGRRVFL